MLWGYAILVFLALCYTFVSASVLIGVLRVRKNTARNVILEQSEDPAHLPFVSILVPAKDEEKFIAHCLESLVQQQYPPDKYEIVVVNDRSTDNTPSIIKDYVKKCERIKYVNIDSNTSGLTGKQNALNEGLKICNGEIILNTDADCIAEPLWVRRTISHFKPQVDLTIGFSTTYSRNGDKSFFADLQSLDMLFLIDAAAGAIGVNTPVSCLGRNLAYRKAILDDMDHLGMEYTVTEDAALIQAVVRNGNKGIAAVYDKDAAVSTFAEESIKQFVSQRVRWIVGGLKTKSWSLIPLYFTFLFHLCIVIFFPLMFFIRSFVLVTLFCILVKAVFDFIRCWRVCKEFERTYLLKLFLPYEIFMIFYSIFLGFGSMFIRKIRWKGEIYKKKARQIHSVQ